jgi:hypothetical protein
MEPSRKSLKSIRNEDIKQAIIDSAGIIQHAATRLGVSRGALHTRIYRNKRLLDLLKQEREKYLDIAEGHLLRSVELGKRWAVQFYLTRMGKERGYGHKMQVDANVNVGGSMRIYEFPDDGRDGYGVSD